VFGRIDTASKAGCCAKASNRGANELARTDPINAAMLTGEEVGGDSRRKGAAAMQQQFDAIPQAGAGVEYA
jgi:hypothetical protein